MPDPTPTPEPIDWKKLGVELLRTAVTAVMLVLAARFGLVVQPPQIQIQAPSYPMAAPTPACDCQK